MYVYVYVYVCVCLDSNTGTVLDLVCGLCLVLICCVEPTFGFLFMVHTNFTSHCAQQFILQNTNDLAITNLGYWPNCLQWYYLTSIIKMLFINPRINRIPVIRNLGAAHLFFN